MDKGLVQHYLKLKGGNITKEEREALHAAHCVFPADTSEPISAQYLNLQVALKRGIA